jgi:hypothetical protein
MGVPVRQDWREPLPQALVPGTRLGRSAAWLAARQADARWVSDHAAPWASRRVRGISSGDGRQAKRPELLPLSNTGAATR